MTDVRDRIGSGDPALDAVRSVGDFIIGETGTFISTTGEITDMVEGGRLGSRILGPFGTAIEMGLRAADEDGLTIRDGLAVGGGIYAGVLTGAALGAVGANPVTTFAGGFVGGILAAFGIDNFPEPIVTRSIVTRIAADGSIITIYSQELSWPGPGNSAEIPGPFDPFWNEKITAPCFPTGTPITLADGSVSNIEDIEAGSLVEAFPEFGSEAHKPPDPVNAGLTEGKVVRTFNNVTEDWVEVHFTDPATGEASTLTATPGHVMLTPEGSYKQLIEMIEASANEPELGDDRSDVQTLGTYTGSVRLVLADSQIVTAQAWSIKYSESTVHLYEEAEMLVTRTEGGLAVQPEVKRGWKTYNFEVEKYHTYIAGGVRVHNMSEYVDQTYDDSGYKNFGGTPDKVGVVKGGGDPYGGPYDNGNSSSGSSNNGGSKGGGYSGGGSKGDSGSSGSDSGSSGGSYGGSKGGSSGGSDSGSSGGSYGGSKGGSSGGSYGSSSGGSKGGSDSGSSGGSSGSSSGGSKGGSSSGSSSGGSSSGSSGGSKGGSNGGGSKGGSSGGSKGGGKKPIVLDLDGNGLDITELHLSTVFLNAFDDGLLNRIAWAAAGDGVLFFDADNDGEISSSREYAFTEWDPTAASDLDALKSVFDTNGDGKLTSADDGWMSFKVAVTQADGSIVTKTLAELDITGMDLTGSATHIELPDGSVITGTTKFTYSDGSTGTAGELFLKAETQGYDVEQVESVNANGDRVQTTTAYAADGSIAFTIESTVAQDGSSTVNRYDMDGDGVVDQVQTITITAVTGGTQKDETLHRGDDVASGILLEAVRTTKTEAAGTRTETIERDGSGGGWYDQVEVRITDLTDDSLTITITDLAQDGTSLAILSKAVSADGLTRTEELDVDADGAFEEKLIHQITVDPVTGVRTETTTRYNPDGSVRDVTTEAVSADGQTRSVATDADGNGANEVTVSTGITVNGDGSTSSQFTITNEDGSLRSSQTHDQSDDALVKTVATDLDGDGTTDLTETDATVLAVDGSRTQSVTQLNGDGSLLSARETWLAENRIETTTHVDLDRNGTLDADEILQDVSLDGVTGEVSAKSYVRAVDGTVLAEETRVTSADGLSTQTNIDADGDGDDDSIVDDVTTINGDGSSTQVVTTKNGDATVRSTVTKWVSADGLTARVEMDSDGNGVLDQVDHVAQVNNVDGLTTTTTQTYAGDGTTLLVSSTTDHSADRRTTTTQTDSNGDGAIDRTSVRVEAIDGSVSLTETALNEDGSVARSSTTTVSADGLTTIVSNDGDGDGVADTVMRTTTVHNNDGSRTDTVRTENSDGTLRAEQVLTTSDDGHTTSLQVDEDGDGVIERATTTTRSYDADGTQRTVEVLTATNGAVLNRVQTLVSDDGLTTDVQLDTDGDGLFDLTTQSVTTLQADGSSVEVSETRDASNALRNSTSVITSDDGRAQTVETDVDGDGNFDRVEQTVIADDGSVTTTRSAYNPDGSLQSQMQTTTGGTGLVSEEHYDQDGDGTFERVEARAIVLNADGSTTTTAQTRSADGTMSFEEVVTVSDDERQVVTTNDVDGDGVVNFTTTETITLATNGVTTLQSETRSRDATLIESSQSVVSADGDTVTETRDWNGDGQADVITTTVVGTDGWVDQTTITYAANGTVEGSHKVRTSDDGLNQTVEHDVANDGQVELTTQDISALQADGSVKRTVTYADQSGQMLAQEEYLTSDDGLSSTISLDLDGDGVDDLIEQIDFETKLDGSTERVSRTTDALAALLSETTTTGSADGLTKTVSTDLDGDGQNDRVDTMISGADGGYVQTIETFDSAGQLTTSRTITLSADGRTEERDVDLDGDGVRDQAMSRTVNANQSTTTLYSDVDGAATGSAITRTVEANGLDSMTSYDLDADGSAEFTRSFTTEFVANGSEVTTLADTAGSGQKTYEEIRTVDADGLTAITTYDYDGDGHADTTKTETTVINADGSRTETTRSTYADGSLHSQTISETSYDGKSRNWRTDRGGNGVIDKELQITVHADGERVETNTTYNATGTVTSTSTTTTSSDGLEVVTVRDNSTETTTYSPTNAKSYTWAYEIASADDTYEVTSDHAIGNDGTEIWTYTKVYSTWQQGSSYQPDATDPLIVDSRTNSQIKTQNGWTQWLITEVTETRLDEQTKQRLFDEAEKLYDTLLDRNLSSSEYEKLIGYTADGVLDLDTLAKELRESDEFVIRYGTLSDADYVQQLYINTFDRAPTMEELASNLASLNGQADPWSGVVDALDRDGLASRLALSAEHELAGNIDRYTDNYDAVEPADGSGGGAQVPSDFERHEDKAKVEAQVKGVFHALYDREPTSTELDSTVTAYLAADAELDWVVTHLIGQNLDGSNPNTISGLAGSELATQAYVNALGRVPTQQEHDAWVAMLANGTLTNAQFIAALAENAVVNTIIGTDGDDVLIGGSVGEKFVGYEGNDTLTGGAGENIFVFSSASDGDDTITDFDRAKDVIDVRELLSDYVPGTSTLSDFVWVEEGLNGAAKLVFDASQDGLGDASITLESIAWSAVDPITFAQTLLDEGALRLPFLNVIAVEDSDIDFAVPTGTFDGSQGPLTYTATLEDGSPLPDWLILDPITGTFSGTPPFNAAGDFRVTVIASNVTSTANRYFEITVLDVSNSPFFIDGAEFKINSYTSGNQGNSTLATLTGGNSVVVWLSDRQDGSGYGVYGQVLDVNGKALGGEFRVNSYTSNRQNFSTVEALADGGFVVSWTSDGQDGSGYGVFAQRFDHTGIPVGAEFQVNSYTNNYQYNSSVTAFADGGFLVLWNSNKQYGDLSKSDVVGQFYDNNGQKIGSEFLVNTYTLNNQIRPAATELSGGNFVVTWSSIEQDGSSSGIFAKIYNRDGNILGEEFQVNSYTQGLQDVSTVDALLFGGFVVIWHSNGQDSDGSYGIYGQRFDNLGNPIGGEFQVNSYSANTQNVAAVTALANGGFVVTWSSRDQDGDDNGIFGQLYDQYGQTIGIEFQVNSYTAGNQYGVTVTALVDGGFMVAWTSSGQDGSGGGIYAQRYAANGNYLNSEVLGIEASDLLFGGSGSDLINGLGGNDTIAGNAGNDTLIGGGGENVFVYTSASDGHDAITDFDRTKDVIDVRALVSGYVPGTSVLSDLVWVEEGANGAANLVFDASQDGLGDVSITLESIAWSAIDPTAFVQELVNDGALYLPLALPLPFDSIIAVEGAQLDFAVPSGALGDASGPQIYSATLEDGSPLPDWLILDPITGTFSGTPPMDAAGELKVIVKATSSESTAVAAFDFKVLDVSHDAFLVDGTEFQVNSYTANSQSGLSAHGLEDGGFVVVWTSMGQDGSQGGVFGQVFASDGTALGHEFLINSHTADHQSSAAVSALADGGFIASWYSNNQDGSLGGVYAQRFDSTGTAKGIEFQVNSHTYHNQGDPSVTGFSDGGFLIVWTSQEQDGSGTPTGSEFRVNTYASSHQDRSAATELADGNVVVTWTTNGQDGNSYGIYAKLLDRNGDALGAEFQVNSYSHGPQTNSSVVALPDGGFVITWGSYYQDSDGSSGVYAQRFNSAGDPVGMEFQIHDHTIGYQVNSTITALANGGFVATWSSDDGDSNGIFARVFDGNGQAVGIEFQVNSYVVDSQNESSVSALADGGFVIAWVSHEQDGDKGGIYAQRYAADGTYVSGEILGSHHADHLFGSTGDDLINGLDGNDEIHGGAGNDTFIFNSGYGADTITDFEGGAGIGDVVEIQNSLAADYAALQAFMDDFGGPDTVIDFGGGDSLTLQGATLADLHSDDFRFVA